MRALRGLALLLVIVTAGTTLWAKDIDHQRGIEVRGGFGMYLDMGDPNTFVKDFYRIPTNYSQTEYTESQGAFGGGFSLLYKSKPYFAWHFGVNFLSTDSATAQAQNASNQVEATRVFVKTVELFVTANYYWHLTPRFNLELGAGPTFYLASMDREISSNSQQDYGDSFYGAHGRSFGFKGDLGLEFFLSKAVSFKLGGGYRVAPVTRFKYIRETVEGSGTISSGEIAYWNNSFDTFEADFSGGFVDLGLRVYFDPATPWNKYGE